jgi:hypothetical protein
MIERNEYIYYILYNNNDINNIKEEGNKKM